MVFKPFLCQFQRYLSLDLFLNVNVYVHVGKFMLIHVFAVVLLHARNFERLHSFIILVDTCNIPTVFAKK